MTKRAIYFSYCFRADSHFVFKVFLLGGVYQSHAEKSGMCSPDVAVDVAAEAQQLQQAALHQVSVRGVAALDQGLPPVQQGVHASRVLAHALLERLHTQKRGAACNTVKDAYRV